MLTQRGRGILASDESNATTGAARQYRGCSRLAICAGGRLLRSDHWHARVRRTPVTPSVHAGKRLESVGVENTEDNRRDWRQLLYTAPDAPDPPAM